MRGARILLALAWAGAWSAPAAGADALGDRLAGSWDGAGTLSSGYDAAPERGRCRIEIVQRRDGEILIVTGTCAVPSGRGKFTLRARTEGEGRLSAVGRAHGVEGSARYRGESDASAIRLASREPVEIDGAGHLSEFEIALDGADGLSMRHWLTPMGGGGARMTLDVAFERRKDGS